MRYKAKELKFEHTCESCKKVFKSGDVKGRYCVECKQPRQCKCGCGTLVKTPGKDFARGCKVRGKTYEEIYGTSTPACGFKEGSLNPMANKLSKERQRKGVTDSYTPALREKRKLQKLKDIDQGNCYGKVIGVSENGEKMRSKLELAFAEALKREGIEYSYEKRVVKLPINRDKYSRKVVDFTVGSLDIEITGAAYSNWIEEFKKKVYLYKQACPERPLLILTYEKKVPFLKDLEQCQGVKVLEIEEILRSPGTVLEIEKQLNNNIYANSI